MSSNEENKTNYLTQISILAFVAIMTLWVLIILGSFIASFGESEQNTASEMNRSAVAERLKAIEVVNIKGEQKEAAADTAPAAEAVAQATEEPAAAAGEIDANAIVTATCFACHSIGLLESPKIGDKAAWDKRLQANGGMDGLVKSSITGKGAMPPRGGNAGLSDAEIRAAIEFMMQ